MGPWAISLLMILGFAGFAVLAWRKLAIVRALQPEIRWDDPAIGIAWTDRLMSQGQRATSSH